MGYGVLNIINKTHLLYERKGIEKGLTVDNFMI